MQFGIILDTVPFYFCRCTLFMLLFVDGCSFTLSFSVWFLLVSVRHFVYVKVLSVGLCAKVFECLIMSNKGKPRVHMLGGSVLEETLYGKISIFLKCLLMLALLKDLYLMFLLGWFLFCFVCLFFFAEHLCIEFGLFSK